MRRSAGFISSEMNAKSFSGVGLNSELVRPLEG